MPDDLDRDGLDLRSAIPDRTGTELVQSGL